MSWESSIEYYRIINEVTRAKLGGFHSAVSLMYSVDFAEIERLQHDGDWEKAGYRLAQAADALQRGGADFVLLCTNTMHKVADALQAPLHIPFLHIADPTAEKIRTTGLQTIGLLGTRFTMEESFYKNRLIDQHKLNVLTPPTADRDRVHEIIYGELVQGVIRSSSKDDYLAIIGRLITAGAQGIILGCTEIGLLIQDGDCPVPLFDTTRLHAEAAVAYALGSENIEL